jgi:hypothetical protein
VADGGVRWPQLPAVVALDGLPVAALMMLSREGAVPLIPRAERSDPG